MVKLLEINGTLDFSRLGEFVNFERIEPGANVQSSYDHLRIVFSSTNSSAKSIQSVQVIVSTADPFRLETLEEILAVGVESLSTLGYSQGLLVMPRNNNMTLMTTIVNACGHTALYSESTGICTPCGKHRGTQTS